MTYLEIQAFLAVVETGSISKAAELLFISQPALSYRLQALEKELECQIVDRQQGIRKATLTDAGTRFIPIAERWQQLWQETQGISTTHSLVLKIGVVHSINSYILPVAYQRFLNRHSLYSLNILTQTSKQLYQSIENKELDIGFLANPLYSNKVTTTPIFKEKMFFICSRDMQLPDVVHPANLKAEKEIVVTWNQEFKTWNDYWFGNKNKPLIYTDNMPMIESFIINNQGWSIVPVSVLNYLTQKEKLKICNIQSGPTDRISYMITYHDSLLSEALQLLMQDITATNMYSGIDFFK